MYRCMFDSNKNLSEIVKNSQCYSDVVRALGLTTNGSGNFRRVKRLIQTLNISTSHFNYRKVLSNKCKKTHKRLYKPEEFLMENWTGTISPVKRWLISNVDYKCKICNNIGIHCNQPLSLQIDHINGNSFDNRLENLRWLCPNCHTQSKTYGGKKLKLHRKKKSEINPNWNKDPRPHRRKVVRPTKETLEKEILQVPFIQLGKKYNVSDNAIRRWCKSYNIPLPKFGKGYWT